MPCCKSQGVILGTIIDALGANSQQLLDVVRSRVRIPALDPDECRVVTAASQVIAQASTLAFQQRSKEISTCHLLTGLLSVENSMRALLFDYGISLTKLEAADDGKTTAQSKVKSDSPKTIGGAIQASAVFWGLLLATAVCGYLTWSLVIPNKSFAFFSL